MSVIDIEIVIDTVTLLSEVTPSQNSAAPTWIDHNKYSFMIVQKSFLVNGQATGDLSIKGQVNDTVRWRSLSLTGNANQSAVLYNISHLSGGIVMDTVRGVNTQPYIPVPVLPDGHQTTPPSYTKQIGFDYIQQTTLIGHGSENYSVYFYVTTEDANGNLINRGYFAWDPAVTVP
jgi:nematocidal protein AidA